MQANTGITAGDVDAAWAKAAKAARKFGRMSKEHKAACDLAQEVSAAWRKAIDCDMA